MGYVNKVFLGDSRDMSDLPDGSVGLIVTSPPYFNVKDYAKDGRQEQTHSKSKNGQIGDISNFQDFIAELNMVWQECFRVLRPNGKLVINTPLMPMLKKEFSTHENRHIFDLNAEIQNAILSTIPGFYLLDTFIWNRTNPSKKLMFGSYPYPTNFYAQNTVEFVTAYVKEGKAIQPSMEIKKRSELSQSEWVEFTKQVWNLPIPGKNDMAFGEHSAIMPEQLAERCIRLYSFVEDLVLDPFAGSGTTLRVAKYLGRKFVGYELMDSYTEVIERKVGSGICVRPRRNRLKVAEKTAHRQYVDDSMLNRVFKLDHLKLLNKIPENSVDLICVDPPYNMKKGPWDTFNSDSEFLDFTRTWIEVSARKLKPGGSFYVFNTPRNAAHILKMFEEIGFEFRNWITWHKKDGFSSTKSKFLPEQETILYFTKPGGTITFNADSIRVPYESTARIEAARKTGLTKNGKRWFPNENGRLCSDVWLIPSERHSTKVNGKIQKALHPTIKPLALMERIILASTNVGDIVLDFFSGSGSTLVAAKINNRNFIGGDNVSQYVQLSRERISGVKNESGITAI